MLYRYRGEGYGAVLKAVVWMLPIVGFLITCPDSVMAGTVGLSCIFMLMLALEKGWYQVAVRKVMAGLGILTVGIPAGILAYFFFFGAEYQKMRIRAMFVLDKEAGRMKGTNDGRNNAWGSTGTAVEMYGSWTCFRSRSLLGWRPHQFC